MAPSKEAHELVIYSAKVAAGAVQEMARKLIVLQLLCLTTALAAAGDDDELPWAKDGCQSMCGEIKIPFPFGIGPGRCYLDGFDITCNTTTKKPYLNTGNIEVLEIQADGLVRVYQFIASDCYNKYNKSGVLRNNTRSMMQLADRPYRLSNVRNKFVAIGCDTNAFITEGEERFSTGCSSTCTNESDVIGGDCSGIGCCSTPIPRGLRSFKMRLKSYHKHTRCGQFNPCSFAFVADQESFHFDVSNFTNLENVTRLPLTLEWSVANVTCEKASKMAGYACVAENSYCYNSTNGHGYRCNCSSGYHGNPYIQKGCQDIDECKKENPCVDKCKNYPPGNYTCSCPFGEHGDGRKNGSGCTSIIPRISLALGIGLGLMLLIMITSAIYWIFKKRKLIKIKEKNFQDNGGRLLEQRINSSTTRPQGLPLKIYTADELKKATENYNKSNILGAGGYGTVYKGHFPDNRIVAVKRSKVVDKMQVGQFINEVVVLCAINHPNVIKLLGCCLETQVPMLVYELVSNGSLYGHLHDRKSSLSLADRLRIAAETSAALAELHASGIIHRDVKSPNILLDDELTAKVSDFGLSRMVPVNQTVSMIQGTYGYLDPEYNHYSRFTEKSDVYSFGVVLLELLTGKKAFDEDCITLTSVFLALATEGLVEILDDRVRKEGRMVVVEEVAEVARRCLKLRGEDRPAMATVKSDLERLRGLVMHPWVGGKESEEVKPLAAMIDPPLGSSEAEASTAFSGTSGTSFGTSGTFYGTDSSSTFGGSCK